MKSLLIVLALAFGSTTALAQPAKQGVGAPKQATAPAAKKEVKKPEIKKPTKQRKAPTAVQKKAEANNAKK